MTAHLTTTERIAGDCALESCETRGLRVVDGNRTVDLDAAERAVEDLLVALGRNTGSEHLTGTPRRVAHAFAELLTPEAFDLTTFPNDENYDELVLVRDIAFSCPRSGSSACPSWRGS